MLFSFSCRLCWFDRPEKQKAELPLVALTLPLAATRLSLSPLGPEPLKDPLFSVPCSRGVWPSQFSRTETRLGKGPGLVRANRYGFGFELCSCEAWEDSGAAPL